MSQIAAIAIGRNEGDRLVACLATLRADPAVTRIIYVDSGSTDGSIAAAEQAGAEVVELDTTIPFTAARARNAGIDTLKDTPPELVQFIDGDCLLDPAWIATARGFLADHPKVAVVCGRRRERFPEASVYNRLCDAEWDTPVGEAMACGGDALMRWAALMDVQGYNPGLIAGEEPEMCLRMRRTGWQVWRLDAEMTLHDAAMTRFGQFWVRMRRGGFAAAEGVAMYGRGPEKHGVGQARKAVAWGIALPLLILLGVVIFGVGALWALTIYPVQIVRLALRYGGDRTAWEKAAFLTVGKFAEAKGVLEYLWRRLRAGEARLIEYK